MSSIIPFEFEGHGVRAVEVDGEPWFVAKDVAGLLGYSNINDAVARHCKGVVKHDLPTESGVQAFSIIPERDVYRLVMRSKLPAAERFEEWVVGEVLPSIRKTGSYGALSADLNDPALLRGVLLEYTERVLSLEADLAEAQPKVSAYERIAVGSDGSMCVTDAAKHLQMRPKDLFAWMQANGWLYRRAGNAHWIGYQSKVQAGYLEHKITEVSRSDGSLKISEQVRVTPKGLAKLAAVLGVEVAA